MTLVTLLTDFGTRDAFVGIMKGVILGICPEAKLVDLTHEIPPQDVLAGALVLRSAVGYFPQGTVHVAVVDPGVGSRRRGLAVRTRKAWLVGPDNGILEPAARLLGVRECFVLSDPRYFLPRPSRTFHGRDIFAPVAAHLARGVEGRELGKPTKLPRRLRIPTPRRRGRTLSGEILYVDRFGNLFTNVTARDLEFFSGKKLSVSISSGRSIPMKATYSDVRPGAPVALVNSWGHLEIAVRNGNAARELGLGRGAPVRVQAV
ncbi:MAG: hypothetical protein KatS3mg076_3072 [Candidatus Binatia bacterium]|nr:MAG: hypothetical protein KatS3mg076_3072 [Candidatus Binatia bacterium]